MGRQVEFCADSADSQDLLEMLEEKGFLALPELAPSDTIPDGVPPTRMRSSRKTGETFFYLVPPGVSYANAFYHERSQHPQQSMLMPWSNPVIEFSPSRRNGDAINAGRIYFATDRQHPNYALTRKGYELIARFLNKWARADKYRARVGPHTVQEVKAGRVRLSRHGEELGVK
jgi:hypothetical protein